MRNLVTLVLLRGDKKLYILNQPICIYFKSMKLAVNLLEQSFWNRFIYL